MEHYIPSAGDYIDKIMGDFTMVLNHVYRLFIILGRVGECPQSISLFLLQECSVNTTLGYDLEKLHKSQECNSTAALILQDFFQECAQILACPQEPHGKPSKSTPWISVLVKGPSKACK
jgi:hypothetical protein